MAEKKAPPVQTPKTKYSFTIEQYEQWKKAGTNTGIVKDFTTWLEEN